MDPIMAVMVALAGLGLIVGVAVAGLFIRFCIGRRRVEQIWTAAHYAPLENLGAVKRLSVLPLIDRKTIREGLACEAGVSYLIRADNTRILFDVGLNAKGEHPSPLLRNMRTLEVTPDQVQYIVVSHLHLDHVGGFKYQRGRTFDFSAEPVDMGTPHAFVPTAMTHSTAKVQVVDGPRVIAPGVATLGPIPRQLFFFGRTLEQSLAINVEGKGIVLVIGCGHPSLNRIVLRAQALFDQPVYGVIGGLHFPVTALPRQRFLGTDHWPWDPPNKKDVDACIDFLLQHHPKVVALSPHDSCDWTIEAFRKAFSGAYQDIFVGQEIVV